MNAIDEARQAATECSWLAWNCIMQKLQAVKPTIDDEEASEAEVSDINRMVDELRAAGEKAYAAYLPVRDRIESSNPIDRAANIPRVLHREVGSHHERSIEVCRQMANIDHITGETAHKLLTECILFWSKVGPSHPENAETLIRIESLAASLPDTPSGCPEENQKNSIRLGRRSKAVCGSI